LTRRTRRPQTKRTSSAEAIKLLAGRTAFQAGIALAKAGGEIEQQTIDLLAQQAGENSRVGTVTTFRGGGYLANH
jgi:hypothetical protein